MNDIRIAFRRLFASRRSRSQQSDVSDRDWRQHAVFTVVKAVLLAPLPYPDAHQVVVPNEVLPSFPRPIPVSYQNYVDWRDRNQSFASLAAVRTTQMTLTGAGEAERPSYLPARKAASVPPIVSLAR